ncbi:MAG: tetratricopeptide repeat protein [Thermodesulfobacteriota bacterium]
MKSSHIAFLCGIVSCTVFLGCGALTPKPDVEIPAAENRRDSAKANTADQYAAVAEAILERSRGNLDNASLLLKKAHENDPDSAFLKRELAMLALQMGQPDQAVQWIHAIIAVHPEDADAWFLLGRIHQEQRREKEAISAFETAIVFDPDLIDAYYVLGDLYMDQNDITSAKRIYSRLVEKQPESYVAHFYLGKIAVREGRTDVGEQELLKVIELAPDLTEPWFELAVIYRQTQRTQDLRKAYEAIVERSPDNVRALLSLGILYAQNGNTEKANPIFRKLAENSLNDPNILKVIVQDYVEPERFAELEPALAEMLKTASGSSELRYLAGMTYEAVHREREAVDHYLQVGADSRFYPAAVSRVIALYQKLKQTDKAKAIVQKAIDENPDIPEFHVYLGMILEDEGQLEGAREAIAHAISLNPRNDQFHFRLGVVLDKMKDKAGAIEAMKQAIAIDPENPNALNYLGYTYAEMGIELDEAESLIQRALEQKPDDGFIIDSLGWVYFKKGNYPKALEYLLKAVSHVPDDPTILEHVADAWVQMNEPQKALEFYRKALEKSPKDPAAVEHKIQSLEKR